MKTVQNKAAPMLYGWVIAAAAAVVAIAVAIVVGKFDYTPSVFFGALVFLVVGLLLGMPWWSGARQPGEAKIDAKGAVDAVQVVAPVASAAAEPVAAAFMAASAMAAPAVAVEPAMAPASLMSSSSGPTQLTSPRNGKADDLKVIEGIGPALEKLCNELGFYHFEQIASWSDADVDWVDQNMKTFKGRIMRDRWVAQAKLIVSEGVDAFRIRAKTNDY